MSNYEKWINYKGLDKHLRAELESLNEVEINDAFYTDINFGTGGMRGLIGVGTNRMNIYTVRKANYGFAKYILKLHTENPTIAIAYDPRHKSLEFARESAKVMASLGVKVYLFKDVTPTPVLSFAVRYLKASGGIVITASHNPPTYNGYKIYDEDGCQLVPDLVDKVINEISLSPDAFDIKVEEFDDLMKLGKIQYLDEELYNEYLKELKNITVNQDLNKENFKVIFTPLHGTAAYLGERILQELSYNYITVKEQMLLDPNFSTLASPNPEDKRAFELAIKYGKLENADLIVATDPDADRVGIAVLDKGEFVLLNGNQTGAILLNYLVNNRKLEGNNVVFNTIVTSELGAKIARSKGLEVISTLTGFKFIGEQIKLLEDSNKKFFFGYEESYGYVIGDFVRDKDSLQALLLCCEVANFYKNLGKTLVEVLDDIYKKYGYYQDGQLNINLEGKAGAERIERIMDYFRNYPSKEIGSNRIIGKEDYLLQIKVDLKETSTLTLPKSNVIKFYLDDGSWLVLRPSGTEPKLKVYINALSYTQELSIEKVETISKNIQLIIDKVK